MEILLLLLLYWIWVCFSFISGMGCYVLNIYYCLLPREQFAYSVVWWGIVPSPLTQALYLNKQHYRRTDPSGVDNNRIVGSTGNKWCVHWHICTVYFHRQLYLTESCCCYFKINIAFKALYWCRYILFVFNHSNNDDNVFPDNLVWFLIHVNCL